MINDSTRSFHTIHVGLLPLEHRFIVIDYQDTRWVIPASVLVDLATAYYAVEGWYEECDIEEGCVEPIGEELRDLVEVNADLVTQAKETYWPNLREKAERISGALEGPRDKVWWFEENGGSVDEMTDLRFEEQKPDHLLWFDEEYKQLWMTPESLDSNSKV